MATTPKLIIDVPLIEKEVKDSGGKEPLTKEVTLPDGSKVELNVFLYGTPREDIQGGHDTINGIC